MGAQTGLSALQTLWLAFGEMEGDVDDGFEVQGFAVAFGGAEFPLGKGAHGVVV